MQRHGKRAMSYSRHKNEHFYVGNMTLPAYRAAASNMFVRGMVELNTRISSRTSFVSGLRLNGIRFNLDDNWDISRVTDEYKSADITYLLQGHTQVKHLLSEKWTLLA